MKTETAEAKMRHGFREAQGLFELRAMGMEIPGMREKLLEAMAWVNDDDVIDALYDADHAEDE